MRKPKLAFKDKPVTEQLALARRVTEAVAGEPALVARVQRLPALQATLAEAEAAVRGVAAARQAWRAEVIRRNAVLRQLRRQARGVADELLSTRATEAELVSAGLELTRPRVRIGPLPMPEGVHAVTGALEGTVKLAWDLIRLRRTLYEVQQRDSVNGPWRHVCVKTRRQCEIKGLVSGRQYWFRVAAFGSAGHGPWSQPACARAA